MNKGGFIAFYGVGGDLFSEGMDEMAEVARGEGFDAAVFRNHGHAALAFAATVKGPLVVMGHSQGGSDMENFADAYGPPIAAGIAVDNWFPLEAHAAYRKVWSVRATRGGRFHTSGPNVVGKLDINATHTSVDNSPELKALTIKVLREVSQMSYEVVMTTPTRSPDREAFNAVFFNKVRHSLFGGALSQGQVDNMNVILDAFEDHGDGRSKSLAYILATARKEVGPRMAPVRETFAESDAEARKAVARRNYGKPAGPHGHVYYGRGYVQLTWLDNYAASADDAGADIVQYPDKMLEALPAAKVLVKGVIDGRFNGQRKGIAHYLPDAGPDDLKNARRTVNITDDWQEVAGYYEKFLEAVLLARQATAEDKVPAPVNPQPPATDLNQYSTEQLLDALLQASKVSADAIEIIRARTTAAQAAPKPEEPAEGAFKMSKISKLIGGLVGYLGGVLVAKGVIPPEAAPVIEQATSGVITPELIIQAITIALGIYFSPANTK